MSYTAESIIANHIKGEIPKTSSYVQEWLSWYRGDVMGFHQYQLYNGDESINVKRKTLQMAKQVAETWANLLLNERCDIVVPEKVKGLLDEILNDNNFWVKGNEGVELTFALSLGAFVVNVKDLRIGTRSKLIDKTHGSVTVDFIDVTKIKPLKIENKRITECAFVSENSDSFTVVIHTRNEKGHYVIYNYIVGNDGKLIEEYEFDTQSPLAWFQIIRPNIANNIKTTMSDNEIGMSIYANSIDTLKAIDTKYDGFDLEYALGRKRMFIGADAWKWKRNPDGSQIKVRTFDPNDHLFYSVPTDSDGKPLISEQTNTLRYAEYIAGIDKELDLLSMKCGLGENFYKFDPSAGHATATQVISDNSTLYRNIKKHEIILESALRGLTKAIIYASNTFTARPFGEIKDSEIKIMFDDSIIEDKEAMMKRDRDDVVAGIMSKQEYREKWYGEDEKTASDNMRKYFIVDMINQALPSLTAGAMPVEWFVDEILKPSEDKREGYIAYVSGFLQSQPYDDILYAGREGEPEPEDTDGDDNTEEE